MLGIDEYTACTIDLKAGKCDVQGAGGVTIRQQGQEIVFPSGSAFSTAYLADGLGARSSAQSGVQARLVVAEAQPFEDGTPDLLGRQTESREKVNAFEERDGNHNGLNGFVENGAIQLLVDVRDRLRSEHQFGLADEIRSGLHELGVELEDSQNGTVWNKRE
jgi:hypothetical protein